MIERKQASVEGLNWHFGQADRRSSQRFQVGWGVVIRIVGHDGDIYNEIGELDDLSSSGGCINLTNLAKIGDKIEVNIAIPMKRTHWIRYYGEVVRLQDTDSVGRIGVKFDSLRPEFIKSGLIRN